jgi:hypothetical protein
MMDVRRYVRRFLLAVLFFTTPSVTLLVAQQPPSPPATQPAPAASETVVVWVNTATSFYHLPGSRHYGKTKHGKYMSQADAVRAGYRPAQN